MCFKTAGIGLPISLMGETYTDAFENAGTGLTYLGVLEKCWNRIVLFPYDGDLYWHFRKCWNRSPVGIS